uniref:Protein kinase domain-containing protein n=1 Tax=Amphimedon queenslandica TaxID=400682 RepID=A0A1X7T660_AMPQE
HLFISGAVFGEYVFVDRLVDPVWLVPQNEKAMIRIGRVFKALKYAIEEIKKYYRPIKDSQDQVNQPRFRFPVFKSFNRGKCRITYQERIKRHVFKGRLERDHKQPVDVIIKFTKRYCYKAHDLMYDKGYAPQLIHYQERVEGTEYTVVVVKYIHGIIHLDEYLKNNPRSKGLCMTDSQDALEALHDKFCHGKLTPNNIFVEFIGKKQYINIVNYKWAGRIGKAKFPFSANIPDGIKPGDPITKAQDRAQLKEIFDSTDSRTSSSASCTSSSTSSSALVSSTTSA